MSNFRNFGGNQPDGEEGKEPVKILYRQICSKRKFKRGKTTQSDSESQDEHSDHDINMYTVVIDSNYPYNLKHLREMQDSSKFVCGIKVIDSSLYKEGARRNSPKFATVVVIGDRMEDMPVTRKIGDILRIQKATQKVTDTGEVRYLVDERSNWCLFSTENTENEDKTKNELIQLDDLEFDEEREDETQQNPLLNIKRFYMPYKYSGKIFNFTENEEKKVNSMRNWCSEFFAKSTIPENLLSNIKCESKEKNLLCKVMKVYEHEEEENSGNETYSVRLKDKNNILWKMKVDRIKYPELRKDDIIRIKSAKGSIIDKENVLESQPHTNIMKFMEDSLIVKNLAKKIQDTGLDVVIRDKEEPLKPLFVTNNEINPWSHLEVSSLLDLFFPKEESKAGISSKENTIQNESKRNKKNVYDRTFDSEDPGDKLGPRYLLEFDVLAYFPQNIKEFVQGLCTSCKMTYSLEKVPDYDKRRKIYNPCPKCKDQELELIYAIKFLIKDERTMNNQFAYPLYLYSHKEFNIGSFFSSVEPVNLYNDDEAHQRICSYMDILTKFNIKCRGAVVKNKGNLMLVDTQLTDLFNE
ncbi:unnamed protein product [Moneuplotes crassus]|uniref:Uncharacterized protein n=1 Tax=Euplotes crassus TaxID=5936 RepID=A0AAD1TZE9_EUPCR|nr:unnamed protein product [Moneuplotes crassus]